MKKAFLSIAGLTLLFSCSINDYEDERLSKRYMRNIDHNFEREQLRLVRHVKPSESMQAGIPKTSLFADRGNRYDDVYYEDENGDEATLYQSEDDESQLRHQASASEDKYRGYFKIGTPYQVSGTSYFPQNYNQFEEVGVASWYGADFHGKETANGEIYNSGEMTAAHRTLPLPSLVRVTNLNNGRSVVVRVNDRGPFAKNRVIDVSEKAAEVLGFKDLGTADVKVELLRDDTDEMLAKLRIGN
jgi:rare lipoprotein A (peptidoglycan hydrolase)